MSESMLKQKSILTCDIEENNLTVIISDDGKGFENKHMKDKARQSLD